MEKNLTKADLTSKLLELNPHLSAKNAESVINIIFDKIKTTIVSGGRVELRGLGVFETRNRKERKLFNPLTKNVDTIKGKRVPFFKMAKKLKEELNND